jgi:hypothetical protein
MAVRGAMHQAGAACLTQLLRQEPPAERSRACPCGQTAHYGGMRRKPILTAVGEVQMLRPYYLCPHCSRGQFPADRALEVEHTEFSPAVRRMLGLVGSECSSFNRDREQMHALAGLEVTTKAVELIAEALGGDIADQEQAAMEQAMQLDLPVAAGAAIPVMYVQIDSTGVPVVRKETTGRRGRNPGAPPRTRDVKLGCVFTQTRRDRKGRPVRDGDSTSYTGAVESAPRVWPPDLRRGPSAGLEPSPEEGGDGRRSRLDLEHQPRTVPRSHGNCGSLSRPPAPVGSGCRAPPPRGGRPTPLDHETPTVAG